MNDFFKKIFFIFFIPLFFFSLTVLYLFPLLQGLILLPLDLLISNYAPWYRPGTILLKNQYMQDSIVQLFPWKHLVFESFTKGILPLWNPYQNFGLPFMANLKSMVFYPLNIFFLFGEANAWNFLLFSQIYLGMLFAYYLARDFKLKFAPSVMTSFAFGLNSYMIGLLEFGSDAHTIIWWPLSILFAKRYIEKRHRKYLFSLGITLAVSLFAGQLQYFGYFIFFLLAFIVYYGRMLQVKPSAYLFLCISICLGIGMSAIQLIPSLELFRYSHRGLLSQAETHEVFSQGLISPDKLFRLLSPDFFGNPVTHDASIGYIEGSGYFGIIPLFFAVFAMIFGRKQKIVRFFTASFLLCLLFSLQRIGEIFFLLKIPLITSGEADRIFTIVLFAGAMLSGFGLSEFIAMKNSFKKFSSACIFLLSYLLITGGYAWYLKPNATAYAKFIHNIFFDSVILGIFICIVFGYIFINLLSRLGKYITYAFLVLVLCVTFFDFFRLGYRFLTFSNKKFFYHETGVATFIQNNEQKTLGRTFGLLEPELGTYLNIYSPETYNPLYLFRTIILLQNLQHMCSRKVSPHSNKYFLTSTGNDLKNTLDFIGVEYVVVKKDEDPAIKYFKRADFQGDFQKIYRDDQYMVYKNLQAYPRFGLYYHDTILKNDNDILKTISNKTIDLRNNLVLEENLPVALTQGTGEAKVLGASVNNEEFQVKTTQPALFYISDTFYPGWRATINGVSTKIYRANYNFRAVLIPKGTSKITLQYIPMSLLIGTFISLISLILLIITSFSLHDSYKQSNK